MFGLFYRTTEEIVTAINVWRDPSIIFTLHQPPSVGKKRKNKC